MKKKKIHFRTMLNLVIIGNVLSAILVVGIILGTVYYRYMQESVTAQMQGIVEQIESYTSLYVEKIINSAEKLTMDVELGSAVENYLSDDLVECVQGKQMMDYILENAQDMHTYIESIAIGTKTEMFIKDRYSIVKANNMKAFLEQEWYQDLQRDIIPYKFLENTYYTDNYEQSRCYVYATKFKNKYYQTRDQEERICLVTFSTEELRKYLDTATNNEAISLYVIDGEGADRKMIYQSSTDDTTAAYLMGNVSETEQESVEKEYVFFEKNVTFGGWRIVGAVQKSSINEMVYRIEPWMVLAIGIVLLLALAGGFVGGKMISKPIKQLSKAMTDIEINQFQKADIATDCLEMEQLVATYNQMCTQIEKLIEDIKVQEADKSKIEFKMLEAQINPHFIYNTLDAVKWVAYVNHSEKIASILESFIRLMKFSLSREEETVLVDSEIALVKEYANIMIFRNNFDIDITYDISQDSRECRSLKLVLQPFLENCFQHAFDADNEEHRIHITSQLEADALVFVVADNGSGFSPDAQKKKQMTGIGIDNIDRRIKLWFGGNYGVKIVSEEGHGTTVIIRQPILRGGVQE